MNKEKLLYSFNKIGKEGINNYDFIVFIGALVLGAFGLDFNLHYVTALAGGLFFMELMWFVCSILSFVITEIIIRKRNKKSNIEKLIDEEINK